MMSTWRWNFVESSKGSCRHAVVVSGPSIHSVKPTHRWNRRTKSLPEGHRVRLPEARLVSDHASPEESRGCTTKSVMIAGLSCVLASALVVGQAHAGDDDLSPYERRKLETERRKEMLRSLREKAEQSAASVDATPSPPSVYKPSTAPSVPSIPQAPALKEEDRSDKGKEGSSLPSFSAPSFDKMPSFSFGGKAEDENKPVAPHHLLLLLLPPPKAVMPPPPPPPLPKGGHATTTTSSPKGGDSTEAIDTTPSCHAIESSKRAQRAIHWNSGANSRRRTLRRGKRRRRNGHKSRRREESCQCGWQNFL
eukprot:jgi/Picre1/30833/NNA_006193.t1